MVAAAFDDDHRSVVEVGHALPGLLALLDDLDLERIAGQERRLDRVRELIDVQDPNVVQLRHTVQVEVVGQDRGVAPVRQVDQLRVDGFHVMRVLVAQLHRDARVLLEHREDLQAAPAADATRLLAVIGDSLQLVNDEARHDQLAEQESRGDDVGDAAVDQRAGVNVGDGQLFSVRIAGRRLTAAAGPMSCTSSARSCRLATVRPIMPKPGDDDRSKREEPAERLRQVCHRQTEQKADESGR